MVNDPWSQTIEAQQPSAKPEWLTPEIQSELEMKNFPLTNDGIMMLWASTKASLDIYKDLEMQYRKICAALLVPQKTEGTVTVPLGSGYNAKVNHKYNYSLKKVTNNDIWASLDKIKVYGNLGPVVAERLVSWTPNFLKTEYNSLMDEAETGNENAKSILKIINDELLTIDEAAPELKIIEPKVKK